MTKYREVTVEFSLPSVVVKIDGVKQRRPMTHDDMRAFGKTFKWQAHEWGKYLLFNVFQAQQEDRDVICVDQQWGTMIACLLLALPGTRRGRPPKQSTVEAEQLIPILGSKRQAATVAGGKAGEDAETVRRRLRPKKPSKIEKRGGGRN